MPNTSRQTGTPASIYKRLGDLETANKVLSGQFKVIIAMGVFFWGSMSGLLYKKLDSIDENLAKIPQIQGSVLLLEYQQKQQSNFNSTLTTTQERHKREIESEFDKLNERLDRTQHGR